MDWKKISLDRYGKQAQLIKAAEECSELATVCARLANGRDVPIAELVDEMADVGILMEQLEHIFGCTTEVIERQAFKIDRLMARCEKPGGL